MKRIRTVFLVLALLCAPLSFASTVSFTLVSGTVVDPNGLAYANGTITATLVISGSPVFGGAGLGVPTPPANTPYTPPTQPVGLDKNGSFSMQLADNNALLPGGSQWNFQVCSAVGTIQPAGGKGPVCFTLAAPITITGVTQSISTNLNAVAPALSNIAGSGTAVGPAQGTFQVQTTPCTGSNPNCVQISGDTKYVIDATTSNTSPTVTCPNNDCNFVGSDSGKAGWVTAQGAGIGQFSFGALTCPMTTILTVNNAQSITLNANCTGNLTATGILVWGHRDGAALHAMNPGCATVYLPSNINIMDDRGFMTTPATCAFPNGAAVATGIPQASLIGQTSNTQLIMTPDFTWSDCTGSGSVSGGVCIGSAASQIWQVVVWGTGATPASNANCANGVGKVIMAPAFGALYFVNLAGICPGTALAGVELNQPDEQWKEGGAQNVGLNAACVVSAKSVYTENLDCHNFSVNNGVGLHVLSTGQAIDTGTFCYGSVLLDGSLTSRNAHFAAGTGSIGGAADAITVNNGGQWRSDGDYINQDACGGTTAVGLLINSGGKGVSRNTVYGSSGGANVAISDGGTFVSDGGNTVSGGAVQADFIGISGWDIPTGACTGTATSSSTLGIQLGSASSPCTSTTVNSGVTMSRAGTVFSLAVNCGTTGSTAGSGVFTLNKTTNGTTTQTTSTCTIGNAGTTCKDFTHTPAFASGDILSVQFATGAAETLANCKVNVVAW